MTKTKLSTLWLLLMLPIAAFANDDAIVNIAYHLCDYLSSVVVRILAIVTIMTMAYRTSIGCLDWRYPVSALFGLSIIIAAASYGVTYFGGV